MPGIVKLHGTSGAGKTTVARDLMKSAVSVTPLGTARRPEAYMLSMQGFNHPLFVLGAYTSPCGGLDTVNDVNDQIRLLEAYAKQGHVFYEGLLASEYYGRLGAVSAQYGDSHLFAFLDTPIEVCIRRIQDRRLAAGNPKLLNPLNTRNRVQKINRLKYRLEHEFRRKTITIPYQDPLPPILEFYHEHDQLEASRSPELLDRGASENPQ